MKLAALGLALLIALVSDAQTTNCVPRPAGLVGWWRGENNGNDSAGTNNGTVINSVYFSTNISPTTVWNTPTQITLTQPVQLWMDTNVDIATGTSPRRFYRVVAVP
ncbi:MAG: hypothetical protein ACREIC_25670 [Limisphaerales bacterium]